MGTHHTSILRSPPLRIKNSPFLCFAWVGDLRFETSPPPPSHHHKMGVLKHANQMRRNTISRSHVVWAGVFLAVTCAGQYGSTDPRSLPPPTSGFVIRPNTPTTFAVAARNLIPDEVVDSKASTSIQSSNPDYLRSARDHIWSSSSTYQPFSSRTGSISFAGDVPTISIDGLDGLVTAVETWEGVRWQSFPSVGHAVVDMDNVNRAQLGLQTPAPDTGQAVLEFTLDSTDISSGIFSPYNRSRVVWDEAAIRRDIFSAFVGLSDASDATNAGFSQLSLMPASGASKSDASKSKGLIVLQASDLFPNAPPYISGVSYLNDSDFTSFFHQHFQIYSQDVIVPISQASRRVPMTPTRLRNVVEDSFGSAILPIANQTRRGPILRITLGKTPDFQLRLLDAVVPFLLPLSRWTVVEDVTWVVPNGTAAADSLRPSQSLFVPGSLSMRLRFLTEAPRQFTRQAVFIVCCAMGVGSIVTGGGGWMGLTSLQTFLLSSTATGCTEPFTEYLFRGTYDILVAPATFVSSNSDVGYLSTVALIVLALVIHAALVKVRCLCADGAERSFWRAANWFYFPVVFLLATTYFWIYLSNQTFIKVSSSEASGLMQIAFLGCWLVVVLVTLYVWFEALREGRDGYYLVTDLTRFSARYRSRQQAKHDRSEARRKRRDEEDKDRIARRDALRYLSTSPARHSSNMSRSFGSGLTGQRPSPQHSTALSPASTSRWKQNVNRLMSRFAFIVVPVGSWPLTRGYGASRGLFRDTSCSFAIVTLVFIAIIASVSASEDCQALFLNSSLVQFFYLATFALVRPFRVWFLNGMWLLIKVIEIVANAAFYSIVVSQNYGNQTAQALPPLALVLLGLNATFIFYAVVVTFAERSLRKRAWLKEYDRAVKEYHRIQRQREEYPNRDLEAEEDAHATLLLALDDLTRREGNGWQIPGSRVPPLSEKERDALRYRHFVASMKSTCDAEEGDYMEWGHTSQGALAASLGKNHAGKGDSGVGTGVVTALSGATLRGKATSPWEVDVNDALLTSLIGRGAEDEGSGNGEPGQRSSGRAVTSIQKGFCEDDFEYSMYHRDFLLKLRLEKARRQSKGTLE